MVLPASGVGDMVKDLMGTNSPHANSPDPRVQQSQLFFAALTLAQKAGCNCPPCQALRKFMDVMTAPALQELGISGDSNNPLP